MLNRTNAQNSSRVLGLTTVTYGGTLRITNVGPDLQAGDTFPLLTATTRTGTFSATNLPPLPPGLGLYWWTDDNFATITVQSGPPVILLQPVGGFAYAWGSFTLSVTARGDQLQYQWYKDNALLSNFTNGSFTLNPITNASGGDYFVIVSNYVGAVTSTVATVTYTNPMNLADSLIAYYNFDEGTGTVAADSSGRGNNASLTNFPAGDNSMWVNGRMGKAIEFNHLDTQNSHAVLTDAGVTLDNQDVFSFSFWAKRRSDNNPYNPRFITPVGTEHWVLWKPTTGVGFWVPATSPEPIRDVWQHFAVTYTRTNGAYQVYVNGTKRTETTNSSYVRTAPGIKQWIMGHSENLGVVLDPWRGYLDEMRIYNRILYPGEIKALYDMAGVPSPVVDTQPQDGIRLVGDAYTFTVVVDGQDPFSYQWQKGTNLLDGATNATFTLTNLQESQSGGYSVVITNFYGSITSTVATLTVTNPLADITTGLRLWCQFDETTGLAAADASTNANTGTLLGYAGGGTNWLTARIGGGLRFDGNNGSNEVVVIPDPGTGAGSMDFATNSDFSLTAWVKAPSAQESYCPIIAKGFGYNEQYCLGVDGAGKFVFFVRSAAAATLTINATVGPNGTWQHVVGVYSRTLNRMKIYVNGIEVGSATPFNSWLLATSHEVTIGSRQFGTTNSAPYEMNFQGIIDDVRVYGRGLTPADVSALYYQPPPEVPNFVLQPVSTYVVLTNSTTLSALASGTVPLAYQWMKGATAILNATNASFTITNAQLSDDADYTVVVTNIAGSATSAVAHVWVVPFLDLRTAPAVASSQFSANYPPANAFDGLWRGTGVDSNRWASASTTPPQWIYVDLGQIYLIRHVFLDWEAAYCRDFTLRVRSAAEGPTSNPDEWHQVASVANYIQNSHGVDGADVLFDFQRGQMLLPGNTATAPPLTTFIQNGGVYGRYLMLDATAFPNGAATGLASVWEMRVDGAPVPLPEIAVQPQDQTNIQWQATTFSVALAAGSRALSYQWYFSNAVESAPSVPLSGGTSASFTIPITDTTNAGGYYVAIANEAGSVTSRVAVLTVPADSEGPHIVSVGSLSGWDVGIVFDKPISPNHLDFQTFTVSAGVDPDPAHAYNLQTVTLRPDGRSVLLKLDPYSNQVYGRGRLTTFNVIGEYLYNLDDNEAYRTDYSGPVIGQVLNPAFLDQDKDIGTVGDPLFAGSAFNGTNANLIEVLTGGSEIGSTSDKMHLVYQSFGGDFVARVRVDSLTAASASSKAGLMARASTTANSQHLGVFATPAAVDGGAGTLQTLARLTSGGNSTNLASVAENASPNNWLELRRTNNTFITRYSSNGVDWIALATRTPSPSFPSTMLVGLATTAHTNTAGVFTKADYEGFQVTQPMSITSQPQPASVIAAVHSSVAFSNAAVDSVLPATYQWRKDGVPLPGETGTNLTLVNLGVTNTGIYTVAISNANGTVVSADCYLTVSNSLPVVLGNSFTTAPNTVLTFPVSQFWANDSDPEGDPLGLIYYYPSVAFSSDFNSGQPVGTALYSNATVVADSGVGNSGALRITPASGGQIGWFTVSNLTPGKVVTAFTASFKLRISEGSATPADGFSFNFTPAAPVGVWPQAGTALPRNAPNQPEEGLPTGLSICFDNYQMGDGQAPAIDVWWNGTDSYVPGGRVMLPAVINSTTYLPVSIRLGADGKLDMQVDGTNVFSGLQTPYVPMSGDFVLGARTGGSYEAHYVDDLSITVFAANSDSAVVTTTAGGTVVITNGVAAYTPPLNYCGVDSFSYTVTDGQVGGTNSGTATLVVTCPQVSGQATLDGFVGTSRPVVFKATDTNGVVLATSTNTLTFANGTANYTLSVPVLTANLSAKTDWNLRKKLPVTFVANQATGVNFALPAGDLNGSNKVDLDDYYLLASLWYQGSPTGDAADLDGNGIVNLDEYFLLSNHWNEQGDPE